MSRLKNRYKSEVKEQLQKKFNYDNPMKIPFLRKVVINMGIAEASKDKGLIQEHIKELSLISGQKPIVTKAKKAISNFKLREGQPIGLKVTLRGKRMYEFVDRFICNAAPRIRDFRGFATKCDGQGNYTLGIQDQQIFPEVPVEELKRTQGMDITFVTTAQTDEECVALLQMLGMPFKNLPIAVAA